MSRERQVLTQRLLAAHGVSASLEEVTAKFEELYQGTATTPGLWTKERLIVPKVRAHRRAFARPPRKPS